MDNRLSSLLKAFENEDYQKVLKNFSSSNIKFDSKKGILIMIIDGISYDIKLPKYQNTEEAIMNLQKNKDDLFIDYIRLKDKLLYCQEEIDDIDIKKYDNIITRINDINKDIMLLKSYKQVINEQYRINIDVLKNKQIDIKKALDNKELVPNNTKYLECLGLLKSLEKEIVEEKQKYIDFYIETNIKLNKSKTNPVQKTKNKKTLKDKAVKGGYISESSKVKDIVKKKLFEAFKKNGRLHRMEF